MSFTQIKEFAHKFIFSNELAVPIVLYIKEFIYNGTLLFLYHQNSQNTSSFAHIRSSIAQEHLEHYQILPNLYNN